MAPHHERILAIAGIPIRDTNDIAERDGRSAMG